MQLQTTPSERFQQARHRDGEPAEPIAIIGIGCRFPGAANDPDSYWALLRDGVDAIGDIPADRWDPRLFYDPEAGKAGKTNARWGGFIRGIDQFDAHFFGISPREAARMDPQQRLLLEVAWEALEDAGVVQERIADTKTAVYVGISSYDYMTIQATGGDYSGIDVYSNTGGALSIAANRISYCFNLKGPSAIVDTACSSALVGVHLACQSIWHEGCSMALAGGVNVLLNPNGYIGFSRLSMLSPDGRCKAFDASANGFVRSEGAGMVVLKPLSRALADGDRIYALIRATGVNQDGRTPGMTVPSQESQAELVRDCCRMAGVVPGTIQYVETHGTGTPVGDPIEARALGTVLAEGRPEGQPCLIGSVKTNIGHLEPASGIAGLIKVALALKHRQIPPNLHFNNPNPDIAFDDLQLRVPCALEPWPEDGSASLASINSFGFGGTNAHAILEGAPSERDKVTRRQGDKVTNGVTLSPCHPVTLSPCHVFPLSARIPAALPALAQSYLELLQSQGEALSLADLCFNAGVRRSHHVHRLTLVAHSKQELVEALTAVAAGETPAHAESVYAAQGKRPGLAFVCSGQGPQWWAMGRQLLAQEPVFRALVEQCDELIRELGAGWSLLEELTAEESASRMQETAIAQPAIFAIQVGLAELWGSWGIVPDAVIGHSVGEVAAGYIAGVLTLEEAVRVIYHRGRCMDFAPGQGKMLAVGLTVDEARHAVAPYGDRVAVAAINSPTSITLSGEAGPLEEIAAKLQQQEVFCRFLHVQYAFHSSQMDPVKEPLLESLRDLSLAPARMPLYSSVTGQRVEGPEWGANYWWQNVRQTVRFTDAVDRLMEGGNLTFVELSPHPVLGSAISACLAQRGVQGKIVPSLRRQEEERFTMLKSLGGLYTQGYAVAWDRLGAGKGRFARLPAYPWQHESYWHEPEESRQLRVPDRGHPLLGRPLRTPTPSWQNTVEMRLLPFLVDHRVQGQVVLPGTGYLEMALALGQTAVEGGCAAVEEMQFVKACFLPEGQGLVMQTTFNPVDSSFTVYSKSQEATPRWTAHARGVLRSQASRNGEAVPAPVKLDEIRARCRDEISGPDCYAQLEKNGLVYGPAFQGIVRLWQGEGEAIGEIHIPAELEADYAEYLIHPATLDSCVQVLFWTLPVSGNTSGVYLPVEIEHMRIHGRLSGRLWCHAKLVAKDRQGMVTHMRVFDDAGQLLVEGRGLRCQLVGGKGGDGAEALDDLLYEYRWRFEPRAGQHRLTAAGGMPAPGQIAATVQADAQHLALEQRVRERYQQIEAPRSALCTALIWQAFAKLGADLRPGARLDVGTLMEQLGIVARHRRVVERFLTILEEDGLLRRVSDTTWEVVRAPDDLSPAETWKDLVAEHPAFIADLILLGRCGQQLPGVLRGETNPLQLIFPEGGLATAEHFYQDSPCMRFYHSVAQQAITRLVEQFPQDRPLRVLEIGAGTGGLTSYVLPLLPADRSTYVFTDLSSAFFSKAEQKLGEYSFVEYQRLDIESEPTEQGFEAHSFDLILASQVLHATADLHQTLLNVRRLLAPAGMVMILEAVRPARWFDLVFGLMEGWWRFADTALRPFHAMLPFSAWQKVLEEAGFTEPVDVSLPAGEESLESAVILARGPVAEEAPEEKADLPAEVVVPTAQGSWLLFADNRGVAEKLAQRLLARGERCTLVFAGESAEGRTTLDPGSKEEMRRFLEPLLKSAGPPWRGVVHLWNLDAPQAPAISTAELESAQTPGCLSLVHLLQVWTEVTGDAPPAAMPGLWLVSGGVFNLNEQTAGVPSIAVSQAPLWGLGRVITSEFPQFHCKMVDLGSRPSKAEVDALVEEMWAAGQEDEVALRGEARYVHRYQRRTLDRPARRGSAEHQVEESYRMEVARSGTIDGLTLRAIPRRAPGAGEIEIQVLAAGLNFSDVMKALGLYPGLPDGPVPLGIECAGRVAAVGSGVTDFQVGDEVVAISPFSFSAYLTIPAQVAAHKPRHLTFAEAATIPIAFLTAEYALNYLGRMAEGERVLIHSATGGVGLAAIQLARKAGAEIFATAGTPEKRELLQTLGIRHVMNSRTLAFADEVREATNGRGVDLVLNSLAGEAIAKGLASLADHGRFLEIGKRDIYNNSRLGLYAFRKNLSLIAIDLDRALRERPAHVAVQFRNLMKAFDRRELNPLPHRVFPISHAASAFRYMSKGRHLGKVVLSLQDKTATIAPRSAESLTLRADASYLITGGLGGFGLSTARWMVEKGARHLVLVSRSGITSPEVQQGVTDLEQAGAQVFIAKTDVGQADAVAALMAEIARTMPPLRGVVHAAMVLDDCLMLNLNQERLQRVLGPKMSGAWNLHTQTLGLPLDFFVQFSTMSCVFGIAGQANYAAGNAFLDALSHYRRDLGLPALTVNWGYLGNVGYVARNEKIGEGFAQLGVTSFTPEQALMLMGRLLQQDASQVGVMRVNWAQQRKMFISAEVPPKFAQLYNEAGSDASAASSEGITSRNTLLAAPPAQRKELLLSLLRDKVARVLGLASAKLDVEKPLTEAGLDSLMAVELRNWVEGELRLNLPIVELMRGPSVSRLADVLITQLSGGTEAVAAPTPAAQPARATAVVEYPLSAGQRALWFVQKLAPEGTAYNMADAVRFFGPLNVAAMTRAFQTLVDRHPGLRTTFDEVDGQPFQRVHPSLKVSLDVRDAAGWSADDVRQRMMAETELPFDLKSGPTARAVLWRIGAEKHVFLFLLHHLVSDLFSVLQCIREYFALYDAEAKGQACELPSLPTTYADFVGWQAMMLAGAEGQRLRSYWREKLAGDLPVLSLPTDRPRPAVQTYRGAWQSRTLSRDLTRAIQALSQAQGTTPFMTLLAAYNVLLHRFTGQDDVMVGCPTMGRSRPEFASVVGYFVNPVVVRADLAGNPSFAEVLKRTRQTVLDAFDHQDYPFGMLVEDLQPRRDPARSPIFQTMFAVRKAPWLHEGGLTDFLMEQSRARMKLGGIEMEALDLEEHDAQFELALQMAEVEGCLMAAMQYNTDLFDPETITRWLLHWETLLEGIVADPTRPVGELPLLPPGERQRVLLDWPAGSSENFGGQRLEERFEARVVANPDAVAVVGEHETLSYGELNRRGNQLASRLRLLGVGPDVLVGLCVERSPEMIVGLLGILKSGGAYLPLDPEYPPERLAFMLEDAKVSVLVTRQALAGVVGVSHPMTRVSLDMDAEALRREPAENVPLRGDLESLAYAIYTSGSTGRPRGVLVQQRSVLNHNLDFMDRYGLTSGDRVLQFASISFDTAAEEIFPTLLSGATLVLRTPLATTSLVDFLTWLDRLRVTVLDLPTAYWHFWVSELTRMELPWPAALRWVIVGGEKVLSDRLTEWLQKVGDRVNWSNTYGPTEATILATTYALISRPETAGVSADRSEMQSVSEWNLDSMPFANGGGPTPIGRPNANVTVYLLDARQQPVPIGVHGEIWIGGAGVARGYLNQPELTAARFVTLAVQSGRPERLYRTGDLARWLPDGNLEFLGRIDHQVKIRGYRIELAEVESRLSEYPGLAESVVLAREDVPGEHRLAAYVVAKAGQAVTAASVRDFLTQRLPGYMVPTAFVLLPALPLMPNGKLDRNALPAPTGGGEEREYVAPRSPEEQALAAVWAEVLGVSRVGVTDNFFELGGDSIQGLQMVSRARQAGLHLTARQMYQHQTIAELVATAGPAPALTEAAKDSEIDPIPLTPIQHWFFEQELGELHGWSQALQLDVQGLPDLALVQRLCEAFAQRHDALRLRFRHTESGWKQTLGPAEGAIPCRRIDLSAQPEADRESALAGAVAELQRGLNVTVGPLARVALIDRGPRLPGRLVLVIHHMVMDSVSWRLLQQDMMLALAQLGASQPLALPPVPTSFRRYARRLAEIARTPEMREAATYWIEAGQRTQPIELPRDHEGINTREAADSVWVDLDDQTTRSLLSNTGPKGTPTQAVLAVALARVLGRWAGTSGMLLDLEGHGRDGLEADLDLSHTVGWLASIHPLWLQWRTDAPVAEVLRQTVDQLAALPHRGVSYGLARYLGDPETVAVLRSQARAEVRLNYIGQLDALPGASESIAPMHRSTEHLHQITGVRRYLLECNGHVADGRLRLGLTYSTNLHDRATIDRLACEVLAELGRMIRFIG